MYKGTLVFLFLFLLSSNESSPSVVSNQVARPTTTPPFRISTQRREFLTPTTLHQCPNTKRQGARPPPLRSCFDTTEGFSTPTTPPPHRMAKRQACRPTPMPLFAFRRGEGGFDFFHPSTTSNRETAGWSAHAHAPSRVSTWQRVFSTATAPPPHQTTKRQAYRPRPTPLFAF